MWVYGGTSGQALLPAPIILFVVCCCKYNFVSMCILLWMYRKFQIVFEIKYLHKKIYLGWEWPSLEHGQEHHVQDSTVPLISKLTFFRVKKR